MNVGISGLAVYVPPCRVDLARWCQWYGQSADKIEAVVGRSFRMRGPTENVYTMAAAAVVRLIRQYDIDPRQVRQLLLGTESSTDNAAGAVVVKGLVSQALIADGLPPISRHCEVPELKHACLGGIYGLKSAARFVALDGADSVAIVVSADVAEYSRGSSGEPTQGAGAVAMLVTRDPTLLRVELARAGSASAYRQVDFRKPLARIVGERQRLHGQIRDFPIFNGRYSTTCYLDATLHAVRDMLARRGDDGVAWLDGLAAAFLHRPYRRMPESGLLLAWMMAVAAGSRSDRERLADCCERAGVALDDLCRELAGSPDLDRLVVEQRLDDPAYPLAMQVIGHCRRSVHGNELLERCFRWGAERMMDIGNLYTAALPAWLAAGLEHAAEAGAELAGRDVLLLGYGSGDAAESIPAQVAPGWERAAARIGFDRSLVGAIDLTQAQYESLHDHGVADGLDEPTGQLFELARVGHRRDGDFVDFGIEYYRYRASSATAVAVCNLHQ